jgi:hypothetical protein
MWNFQCRHIFKKAPKQPSAHKGNGGVLHFQKCKDLKGLCWETSRKAVIRCTAELCSDPRLRMECMLKTRLPKLQLSGSGGFLRVESQGTCVHGRWGWKNNSY